MNPDKEVIRKHGQLYENSCTPMIVELILKLTGRVPENYFELQDVSKNTAVSFADFHEQEIGALKLRRRFSVDAGRDFPPDEMKQLFDTIDGELNAGRYVAVSIAQGPELAQFCSL